MKLNKLTIHLGKTKVQVSGSYKRVSKDTNESVKYENKILEQVSSAKLLGTNIESNITCQDQYNYICKKISQKWCIEMNQRLNIGIFKMKNNSI